MHSFFAAFFTLVFSFSHAASIRRGVSLETGATASTHHLVDYIPSRRDRLHTEVRSASYAGSSCASCRRMNILFRPH